MMGAVLQLERFGRTADEAPPAIFAQADLDAAFERGRAEGRQQTQEWQKSELRDTLAGLSRQLEAEHAARVAMGAGGVMAIAPLIEALLDGIIPAVARARLQAALLGELLSLASAVTPPTLHIRCGPDLAAFIEACLSAAGLAGIEIDRSGPEGVAEADLLGSRVTWDIAQIAGSLRELVNELIEVK